MAPKSETRGWQNIPEENFKPPLNDIEVFKKLIDILPYPVAIYSSDGTAVYINEAGLKMYQIDNARATGKYNLYRDPTVDPVMPLDELKRLYKGETVFFPAVKVPLAILSARDGVEYNMEALYMDMTFFPIMTDGCLEYIVQHQIPCRIYRGKKEIEKAKEYIDNNWLEKFNRKNTAMAACLSPAHLTRLFRRHTGMTMYEYYLRVKISKLKEKLRDPDLSVTKAFSACNLNYNGHFARVFKKYTGITPSEYKKI